MNEKERSKRKREKGKRRGGEKKKAMVALLLFIMVTILAFETVGRKNQARSTIQNTTSPKPTEVFKIFFTFASIPTCF